MFLLQKIIQKHIFDIIIFERLFNVKYNKNLSKNTTAY